MNMCFSSIPPFFIIEQEYKKWVASGHKYVHLSKIGFLLNPLFSYEVNAKYLVSIIDISQVEWIIAYRC